MEHTIGDRVAFLFSWTLFYSLWHFSPTSAFYLVVHNHFIPEAQYILGLALPRDSSRICLFPLFCT